jgi:hypothetical protein
VTAITSAVRGRQLNLYVGPFLMSYLLKGLALDDRERRLMTSVVFRDYFTQFSAAIDLPPAAEIEE